MYLICALISIGVGESEMDVINMELYERNEKTSIINPFTGP